MLLACASLAASRTLLQWLLTLLNFTLDSEDLFYWFKQKTWFLWTMAVVLAVENCGDERGLTWYLRVIYIISNLNPLTKFTKSSRSPKFKNILPWNISQMIMKTPPVSTRIGISYAKKRGISLRVYWKVNGNWGNNMIRIFQWRESHRRTNTSIKKERNLKDQDFETQSRKVHQFYQFYQNRLASPYDGHYYSDNLRSNTNLMYRPSKCNFQEHSDRPFHNW